MSLMLHTERGLLVVLMDVVQYFHFIQVESGKDLYFSNGNVSINLKLQHPQPSGHPWVFELLKLLLVKFPASGQD